MNARTSVNDISDKSIHKYDEIVAKPEGHMVHITRHIVGF